MNYPNYDTYDTVGYDVPALPYLAYAPLVEQEHQQESTTLGSTDVGNEQYRPDGAFTGSGVEPGQYAQVPLATPRKKKRRLWMTLGVIAAVLLVLAGSGFGIYSYVSYVNRSTPTKTLDAFCTDLQKEDYKDAYKQFSKDLQNQLSEPDFASYISPDKVVSCTHGVAKENSASSTTNLKLVHTSKGINDDLVTLKKDDGNNWKIDDLQKAA